MFVSTPPGSSISREDISWFFGGSNTRWYTSVCVCVCVRERIACCHNIHVYCDLCCQNTTIAPSPLIPFLPFILQYYNCSQPLNSIPAVYKACSVALQKRA